VAGIAKARRHGFAPVWRLGAIRGRRNGLVIGCNPGEIKARRHGFAARWLRGIISITRGIPLGLLAGCSPGTVKARRPGLATGWNPGVTRGRRLGAAIVPLHGNTLDHTRAMALIVARMRLAGGTPPGWIADMATTSAPKAGTSGTPPMSGRSGQCPARRRSSSLWTGTTTAS